MANVTPNVLSVDFAKPAEPKPGAVQTLGADPAAFERLVNNADTAHNATSQASADAPETPPPPATSTAEATDTPDHATVPPKPADQPVKANLGTLVSNAVAANRSAGPDALRTDVAVLSVLADAINVDALNKRATHDGIPTDPAAPDPILPSADVSDQLTEGQDLPQPLAVAPQPLPQTAVPELSLPTDTKTPATPVPVQTDTVLADPALTDAVLASAPALGLTEAPVDLDLVGSATALLPSDDGNDQAPVELPAESSAVLPHITIDAPVTTDPAPQESEPLPFPSPAGTVSVEAPLPVQPDNSQQTPAPGVTLPEPAPLTVKLAPDAAAAKAQIAAAPPVAPGAGASDPVPLNDKTAPPFHPQSPTRPAALFQPVDAAPRAPALTGTSANPPTTPAAPLQAPVPDNAAIQQPRTPEAPVLLQSPNGAPDDGKPTPTPAQSETARPQLHTPLPEPANRRVVAGSQRPDAGLLSRLSTLELAGDPAPLQAAASTSARATFGAGQIAEFAAQNSSAQGQTATSATNVTPAAASLTPASAMAADLAAAGTPGAAQTTGDVVTTALPLTTAAQNVSLNFASAPQIASGTPAPVNALAINIAKSFDGGATRFQVRMDPPELGRVDVKIDMSVEGRIQAHLTVERSETLDLMMRDARSLEKALAETGLNLTKDSLTFSLKDQNAFNPNGEPGGEELETANPGPDTEGIEDQQPDQIIQGYISDSGVDIVV